MRSAVDTGAVLEQNRRFHDGEEASIYDSRMGISHDADAAETLVAELQRVLGRDLPLRGTALDVGTGTGHVAIKLALTGRFDRIIAVDISTGMLDQARENAARAGCEIETVCSDMARLPFPDGTVDFVVGCAVLHHLPDPGAFMEEVKRVLSPGGWCVFIGEPTAAGSRVIDVLKAPLVTASRIHKAFRKSDALRWEHDNIDVHTFSARDAIALTRGLDQVRIVPEGFLEPIVDQSIFTATRAIFKTSPTVGRVIGRARRFCRKLDTKFLNRIVPRNLRVSMKFAGMKPQPAALPTNVVDMAREPVRLRA